MKSTLRNLINERCPELLELKMGCEIYFHNETETEGEYIHGIYVGVVDDVIKVIRNNNMMYVYHYDILGTPPSWSDYLRCLGYYFAIDGDGYIMRVSAQGWSSIDVQVDLTRSPLEQPDEILQKLVDLIPPL